MRVGGTDASSFRILGLDPGSRITGYGILEVTGRQVACLGAGCITLPDRPLADRLPLLFSKVRAIVDQYHPNEIAVEEIFVYKNVASALVLAHARGVAIAAAMLMPECLFYEYGARAVKKTIVGTGSAAKDQVAYVIKNLLRLSKMPTVDATDALAIALCHVHHRRAVVC